MKAATLAILYVALMAVASAEVYFKETFDKNWENRWVKSKNKEAEGTAGTWELSHGKYYRDAEEDLGLKTAQDARFYQISAAIPKEFSNKGKDLVVQYSVKHEQKIDCGGGYLKLLPTGLDQSNFNGDSSYYLMFGPDICGSSTKKTHLIFGYKGKNHLIKKDIKCETDEFTHLYTLVIKPDNTYEVLIDEKSVAKGSIKEDFDMLPPKEIADPDAKKPEDWDDELDGEWEAPMIDNPEFKGEWKPKMIPNPAYKGEWVHPMIPNPDYFEDDNLYAFDAVKYVGIEIWQVKAGTIFDNIIVTDNVDDAHKLAEVTKKLQEAEKEQHKKDEEEKQKQEEEERKQREAEEAANAHEEEEEEDEEAEHASGKDEL